MRARFPSHCAGQMPLSGARNCLVVSTDHLRREPIGSSCRSRRSRDVPFWPRARNWETSRRSGGPGCRTLWEIPVTGCAFESAKPQMPRDTFKRHTLPRSYLPLPTAAIDVTVFRSGVLSLLACQATRKCSRPLTQSAVSALCFAFEQLLVATGPQHWNDRPSAESLEPNTVWTHGYLETYSRRVAWASKVSGSATPVAATAVSADGCLNERGRARP